MRSLALIQTLVENHRPLLVWKTLKWIEQITEIQLKIKVTVIPVVMDALRILSKRVGKCTGNLGNKNTSGDHQNYSIIEIVQNTEKSPRDLSKLAVGKPIS